MRGFDRLGRATVRFERKCVLRVARDVATFARDMASRAEIRRCEVFQTSTKSLRSPSARRSRPLLHVASFLLFLVSDDARRCQALRHPQGAQPRLPDTPGFLVSCFGSDCHRSLKHPVSIKRQVTSRPLVRARLRLMLTSGLRIRHDAYHKLCAGLDEEICAQSKYEDCSDPTCLPQSIVRLSCHL